MKDAATRAYGAKVGAHLLRHSIGFWPMCNENQKQIENRKTDCTRNAHDTLETRMNVG